MKKNYYDLFISYHGDGGGKGASSYEKAAQLYDYLTVRGLKCFLYKKSTNEDFYDAINEAVRTSRHFVLVAREKAMLSTWVGEELKQFDGMRKNGDKPHCFISAFLFGEITEKELYNFNPVFATKDVARGEGGFEKIYQSIVAKNKEIDAPRADDTSGAKKSTSDDTNKGEVTPDSAYIIDGTTLFGVDMSKLKPAVVIPPQVKEIADHAFEKCGVVTVDLNQVEIVGDSAFHDCKQLKSIIFSKN